MAGLLSRATMNTASKDQRHVQVVPMRIVTFDQVDLPVASIFLERLLAPDRRDHALVVLVPDKSLQSIRLRESIDHALTVLPYALPEVVRHTGIERAVFPVAHHGNGDECVAGNH